MIKMEIKGLDKLKKSFKRLERNIRNLDGKKITVTNDKDIDKKISDEIMKGV